MQNWPATLAGCLFWQCLSTQGQTKHNRHWWWNNFLQWQCGDGWPAGTPIQRENVCPHTKSSTPMKTLKILELDSAILCKTGSQSFTRHPFHDKANLNFQYKMLEKWNLSLHVPLCMYLSVVMNNMIWVGRGWAGAGRGGFFYPITGR